MFIISCKKEEINNRCDEISDEEDVIKDYNDDKQVIIDFVNKVYNYDSYYYVVTGESVTNTIIKYKQKIYSEMMKKGSDAYYYSDSSSILLKTNFRAFFHNDIVNYIKDSIEGLCSLEEYKNIYGPTPFDDNLMGYVINNDSIISVSLINSNNHQYEYVIQLDGKNYCDLLKRQMKEFGDLNALPEFLNVEFRITLRGDFYPISIKIKSEYLVDASVIGSTECEQNLEVVFKSINEEIIIPEK